MNTMLSFWPGRGFALAAVALLIIVAPAFAQQPRRLAPGVVTTIPPTPMDEEMFSGVVAEAREYLAKHGVSKSIGTSKS